MYCEVKKVFFFFLICLLIITLNNYIYKTHTHKKKDCQIITGGVTKSWYCRPA